MPDNKVKQGEATKQLAAQFDEYLRRQQKSRGEVASGPNSPDSLTKIKSGLGGVVSQLGKRLPSIENADDRQDEAQGGGVAISGETGVRYEADDFSDLPPAPVRPAKRRAVNWGAADANELELMFGDQPPPRDEPKPVALDDSELVEKPDKPARKPLWKRDPKPAQAEPEIIDDFEPVYMTDEEDFGMSGDRKSGMDAPEKTKGANVSDQLYKQLDDGPTLSRRQRRQMNAEIEEPAEETAPTPPPVEEPTRLFKPIRTPEDLPGDEEPDEEPAREPKKRQKKAKARPAPRPRYEDDDEDDYDDYDDDDYDDEYDEDDDEDEGGGIARFFISLVRSLLILVLVLAIGVIALRQLEANDYLNLSAIRGSRLPSAITEFLFPQPAAKDDVKDDPTPEEDADEEIADDTEAFDDFDDDTDDDDLSSDVVSNDDESDDDDDFDDDDLFEDEDDDSVG